MTDSAAAQHDEWDEVWNTSDEAHNVVSKVVIPPYIELRQRWKRAFVELLEKLKGNSNARRMSFTHFETFQRHSDQVSLAYHFGGGFQTGRCEAVSAEMPYKPELYRRRILYNTRVVIPLGYRSDTSVVKRLRKDNDRSFNKVPESLRLEEHIELPHLHALMEEFDNHRPETRIVEGTSKYAPTKYEHREPGALNPEEFKETIAGVLGTRKYDEQLDKLFTKLDTSADGFVDWNEFATYMLLHYRENDYMRTKKEMPFLDEPKIKHVLHNRQECTVKAVSLDNPLRYLTVNKDGALSIWSTGMTLEYTTFTDPELEDTAGQRRRLKMWVTDMIYLPNCHKVIISSTRRDLRFYDIAGNQMMEDYHLYGLNNVPHCLDYHYNDKDPNGAAVLLWGDEAGDIHLLEFKTPVTQLFEKSFTKQKHRKTNIYMQDILKHERLVQHTVIEGVHRGEPIKRISYIPENDRIISGSASPKSSVTIIDRKGDKKPYVFKLAKGVYCLALSKALNLLATGTPDHLVRLWSPYVCHKPIAVLEGHYSAVLDVAFYDLLEQVFSYSADATLKIWDVKEYTCLQTIMLKFPTSLHGHIPDHGPFPLHLQSVTGSPHNCLLVACNDYIAKLKLGQYQKPVEDIPRTHNSPLCSAIYNEFFREVVTGADDSSLISWDFETGNKNLVFTNAHGDEEITCMAFDGNWRRLITGARDGSIKVWNFQNGHNLHKLEPIDDSEVTGVLSVIDKEFMLAVGWSRQIIKYDDSEGDNLYIEVDDSWKGGIQHKDDILGLAFCPPFLLATGSFDAQIIVWTLETETPLLRLDASGGAKTLHTSQASADRNGRSEPVSSAGSEHNRIRPNSRHRRIHLPPKGVAAPIDKLLFLTHRVDAKMTEAGVLISSQAGVLKFWSIFSSTRTFLLGEFMGTHIREESVLAMACNEDCSLLVTGDTQGFIYTWSIGEYCIRPTGKIERESPGLVDSWRAHESAVVSVEFVEHTNGDFLLTASTDKTARIFTVDGRFVGTFGQADEWNLGRPETWIHPLTPFSEEYLELQTKSKASNDEPTQNTIKDVETSSLKPTAEKDETLASENNNSSPSLKPVEPLRTVRSQTHSVQTNTKSDWVDTDLQIRERAKTFHQLAKQAPKTGLGVKAENELFRSRMSRQQRRGMFGSIDKEQTNRYGVQCCPFQVLATKELNANLLPKNLPVTQRMIQRGYTSANLNESTIKHMDLSILNYIDTYDDGESKKKNRKPRLNLPSISTNTANLVSTTASTASPTNN